MRKSAVEKSAGLIIVAMLALMIVPVNADVARVTDYRVPGMVDQINAVVDVVNGAVDGSNKIDGEIIANDTIDDDSIDFSDVTLNDITPDIMNVGASGVSAKANGGGATNIIITADAQLEGAYLKNDSVGKAAVGVIAQSDTNVTTVASTYTPDFMGQVLVGRAGEGTNSLWIAKGTTSNDWLKITIVTE